MNLKKLIARVAVKEASKKIVPMDAPTKVITKKKVTVGAVLIAAALAAANAAGYQVPAVVQDVLTSVAN